MKHSTLIQSLAVLLAALLLLAAGGCTAASKPVAPPTQTEAPTESETPAVFEVRFELNGGTLESGKLLQYVAAGEDAIVPVAAREGYVLDGWDGDYENVQRNAVAVARWTKVYTIDFDPGEGTVANNQHQQVKQGDLPFSPTASREGWNFEGWEPAVSPAEADFTYVAKWSRQTLTAPEINAMAAPAVFEIHVYDKSGSHFATGTGFFIDDRGTAVTNFHVMDGGVYSAKALLSDGTEKTISGVWGYGDSNLDLAVIQVSVTGNPYLTLSKAEVVTGETVYAIGSSLGYTGTFSSGNVSNAHGEFYGIPVIQHSAPISHGNSGGPLLNAEGEVIGVNTWGEPDGQNLNFSIPVARLDDLDRENLISMESFGAKTEGTETQEIQQYYEIEPNDELDAADAFPDDGYIIGVIDDQEDWDLYWIDVEAGGGGTICIRALFDDPAYLTRLDFALFRPESDGNIAFYDCEWDLDENGLYTLDYSVDTAGTYFFLFAGDEDYAQHYPIAYLLLAWVE